MVKGAYGNGIAASLLDLRAIRQRLAEAEVDAATGSASAQTGKEEGQTNKLLTEVSEAV